MHGIDHNSYPQAGVTEGTRPSGFKRPQPSSIVTRVLATAWLGFVMTGAALLELHATTPGQSGALPLRWPSQSRLAPSSNGATLVVFVHPYCPCARATLGELAGIMRTRRQPITAFVLFVVTDGENPSWEQNELWQAATAIPGVCPVVDTNGREAHRFGTRTSGYSLFFNQQRTCLFAGGITASRGHAGDNAGRQAILAYLANTPTTTRFAPTFGCPLFANESTTPAQEAP